jgi:hypothetical protein
MKKVLDDRTGTVKFTRSLDNGMEYEISEQEFSETAQSTDSLEIKLDCFVKSNAVQHILDNFNKIGCDVCDSPEDEGFKLVISLDITPEVTLFFKLSGESIINYNGKLDGFVVVIVDEDIEAFTFNQYGTSSSMADSIEVSFEIEDPRLQTFIDLVFEFKTEMDKINS